MTSNLTINEGIAVIIDDEVDDEAANVQNLVRQLKNHGVPFLTYDALPPEETIRHLHSISFLILDWRLDAAAGDIAYRNQALFIKQICDVIFCPIFIFTNEDVEFVLDTLRAEDISPEKHGIIVKSKGDLQGRSKLIRSVEEWTQRSQSAYVMKTWEKSFRKAKVSVFSRLFEVNPRWPDVFWRRGIEDKTDPAAEVSDLIQNSIFNVMEPVRFDEKCVKRRRGQGHLGIEELRSTIESSIFVGNEYLPDTAGFGDVFKTNGKYYVNIRAACDLISRDGTDVDLYLVKGKHLSSSNIKKAYQRDYGNFRERITEGYVFPIQNKVVKFDLKSLTIEPYENWKARKIGRLLPPYSTRLQQRFASFLTRVGIPRTPKESLF